MWVADMNFACDFIARHFPGVQVAKPTGTYMLFLDCTDWCAARDKTPEDVLHAGWDVGVAWQDGRPFHGPCSIRMNLALPLSRVQEAMERLDRYVFTPKIESRSFPGSGRQEKGRYGLNTVPSFSCSCPLQRYPPFQGEVFSPSPRRQAHNWH